QFEEQHAQEHVSSVYTARVNHVPYKVLTNAISSPVHVCELVLPQHRIPGPWSRSIEYSTEIYELALRSKSPVGIEYFCRSRRSSLYMDNERRSRQHRINPTDLIAR